MHRTLITHWLVGWAGGFVVVLCLAPLVSWWFLLLLMPFSVVAFEGLLDLAPYLNQTGRRHLPWLARIRKLHGEPGPELLTHEPRNILAFAPNPWYVQPLSVVAEDDMLSLAQLHQFVHSELAHVNKQTVERSLEQVEQSLLAFCSRLLDRPDRWMWVRYEDARKPVMGNHAGSLTQNDALDAFTQLTLAMQFFVEQSEQRSSSWDHVPSEAANAYRARIAELKRLLPLTLLETLRNYVAHIDRPPIWILGFLRREDSRLGRPVAELEVRLDAHRLLTLGSLGKRKPGNAILLDWIEGVDPEIGVDLWPLLCDVVACVQSLCDEYDALHSDFLRRGRKVLDALLRQHPEVPHSQVIFNSASKFADEQAQLRPAGDVFATIDLEQLKEDAARLESPCKAVETLARGNVPLVDPREAR